jgi:hypothetical protein
MSETTEQMAAPEVQPPAEGKTDAMRVELLEAKNLELKTEKQKVNDQLKDMQRQMADLQSQHQKAGQDRLVKNQEFETLWKDASSTNSSLQEEIAQLKQQLQDKDVAFQQQQIKSAALNAIAKSGVVNPEQAFSLMKDSLRLDENGNPVCLSGGVQVELDSHLNSLKQPGSGWEHHFSGSNARGMGAAGSSIATGSGQSWSSMSAFERMAVEAMDEQNGTNNAARLKAAG